MGAARRRRSRWTGRDVQQAKMTEEIGLKQPVEYTDEETAHDRHARGRARDGRVPRRPEPQARGAVDHQAPRRARSARAQRRRGALHAHPFRAARDDEDRVRRDERRGAVLRRVGHRSVGRPRARDDASRRRWSVRSAWPDRSSRTRRSRPVRSRRASSARCSATRTRAPRSRSCSTRRRPTCR